MPHSGRWALAAVATIPVGLALVSSSLAAAMVMAQQILSTFTDVSEASWASFVSPAVLLGIQSPGGTGGFLDAILGGPGSPGGTVGRFFTFLVAGALALGAYSLLKTVWSWAKQGGNA